MSLPGPEGLDTWLTLREAAVGGVRPGCEKRIVWAGAKVQAGWAIVYIHGFSATGEELRPLPDLVAEGLGAHVFYTRLAGHGQDGAAMGRATLAQWQADTAEALAIGAKLGRKVLLMGCSTGCPLIAAALARQDAQAAGMAAGMVFISPNFGLTSRVANGLLQLPGVRRWGPWLLGRERSFDVVSDAHGAFWTTRYDSAAVFTMAEAVEAAWAAPFEKGRVPAYVALCENDKVVRPALTRAAMARWGGPVTEDVLLRGEGDDEMGHVMAGDVFSPGQTAPLARRILSWVAQL